MAYIPRSSFTPTNASAAIPAQVKKRRTIRVFGVISVLMILGALLGTVSVFLYNEYALKQLDVAKIALQKESDVDNEKYIKEIRVYDKKLRIANYLLDSHIAPSRVFELLEGSVKETIQFEELEFTYDPGFEATLVVNGVTEEFASLALQEIQLDKDRIFSQYILHDIALITEGSDTEEVNIGNAGKVGFVVTGLFEKDLLLYTGKSSQTLPVSGQTMTETETGTPSLPSVEEESDLDTDNLESIQI